MPAVRTYAFLFPRRESVYTAGHAGFLGFVAINNADDAWSTTFSTGLPMGLYCNVVEGSPKAGTCSGTSYVQSHVFLFAPIDSSDSLPVLVSQIQDRYRWQVDRHHRSTAGDCATHGCAGYGIAHSGTDTAGVDIILRDRHDHAWRGELTIHRFRFRAP